MSESEDDQAFRDAELTPEQIEVRVQDLEAHTGLTRAEVIALAEKGELFCDPEYEEFLIMLDRYDLVDTAFGSKSKH